MTFCGKPTKNGKPCDRKAGHAGLCSNKWCAVHPENLRLIFGERHHSRALCALNQRQLHASDARIRAAEKHRNTPAHKMLAAARTRAKQRRVPFALSLSDMPSIPDVCPVLGIELKTAPYHPGKGQPTHSSPSLDRIRPDLGYVPGNIRIISYRANMLKRDATPEELRLVAEDSLLLSRRFQTTQGRNQIQSTDPR